MGLLRRLRQLVLRAFPERPTAYPGTCVKVTIYLTAEAAPVFGLDCLQGTPRRWRKDRTAAFSRMVRRYAGAHRMEAVWSRPPKVPTIIER